jgi:hypothetical protein
MTVNGKRVSKADVTAADDELSVIHIVTEVLYPLVDRNHTIAQVLKEDKRFSTLYSALETSGLLDSFERGVWYIEVLILI